MGGGLVWTTFLSKGPFVGFHSQLVEGQFRFSSVSPVLAVISIRFPFPLTQSPLIAPGEKWSSRRAEAGGRRGLLGHAGLGEVVAHGRLDLSFAEKKGSVRL